MSFRINQFLSCLGNGCAGKMQREIINKRYLEGESVCDYMVYSEIGMAERIYHRWKFRAISNFAFALKLEIKK